MTPGAQAGWWRAADLPPVRVADGALAFGALLIFVILLVLAPQASVPELGRIRLALLVGAAAVLMHGWARFSAGLPLLMPSAESRVIGVLLAWIVVTLPLSRFPGASLQILIGDFLKTLGVFWLLSHVLVTRARLRTAAWVLSLTALPLAATGVRNFLSGHLVRGRVAGFEAPLTADPNALAMVLNLILPLTVALFLISRRPAVRVGLGGLIALEAAGVVVTFSRGGFLTLAAIIVLYLRTLQRRRSWRWAAAAAALVLAATPLLPLGYLERLGTINNIQADETGSAQERWELTRQGLRYAVSHPFVGAGLGMSVLADCARRGIPAADCGRVCSGEALPPCLAVHNVYLQLAMDLGWPGPVLFLLLLGSAVRSAARASARCAGSPELADLAALADAVRISILGFALAALFYPWAYFPYVYLLIGLAVAAHAVSAAETGRAAGAAA